MTRQMSPVTAFRTKGQDLVDLDLVPQVGDMVEVTGSLSVSAERMGLWLQAPAQLVIERGTVVEMALGDITPDHVGNAVEQERPVSEDKE